ncbi:hypothetical protein ACH4U6_33645 [Streptomyces netropsis]|uniref:hypothetical protein n=1 Tax=Streptomyces netropsis TaxID=55404 RepID=UPI0037985C96
MIARHSAFHRHLRRLCEVVVPSYAEGVASFEANARTASSLFQQFTTIREKFGKWLSGVGSSASGLEEGEVRLINAGLGVAAKWGDVLGLEKLEVALKALEPQLKREYQARLKQLDNQRLRAEQEAASAEAELERAAALAKAEGERAARDAEKRRNHVFRMSGLITGRVSRCRCLMPEWQWRRHSPGWRLGCF